MKVASCAVLVAALVVTVIDYRYRQSSAEKLEIVVVVMLLLVNFAPVQ